MAFLTEDVVVSRADRLVDRLSKRATDILTESIAADGEKFDVFLSHSSQEPDRILLGVRLLLQDRGLSVYVDKYSDPSLSPHNVTKRTADILRGRMRDSRSLLYIHSRHSGTSRWMPWELGFFDGLKGAVGVLPVTQRHEENFSGQEYLNLYPYVDIGTPTGKWWINAPGHRYVDLEDWIRDPRTLRVSLG